jgi:lysophospholipase L1-like esterase
VIRATIALLTILLASCTNDPAVRPTETRTPEESRSTMPQTLHVVTLGDSLAFGAGDERGGGITSRLRTELTSRGVSTVETVNLGVNGARTGDVLQRLRQPRVRDEIAKADAVVLSVGANDLFRSPHSREELISQPFAVAERILDRIETIVEQIHQINPRTRVLVLGGYNPVPQHEWAATIDQYLVLWDEAVTAHFENEPRVAVVRMSDIVVPNRLSRFDSFHPGAEAYDAAARRIAGMLLEELSAA